MEICFFKTTFGLKFFTSSFNWRLFWIPDISRQPIIFHNNSISTFDRHVKLYSSTKFHAFNQNSHNPCTYPPHYRFRLAKEQLCMWNRLLRTFLSHCYTTATWYLISKPNIMRHVPALEQVSTTQKFSFSFLT